MTSKVWIWIFNNIKEAKSISPKQKRKQKKIHKTKKSTQTSTLHNQPTNLNLPIFFPSKPHSYSPSGHSKVPPTSEASKSKSGKTFNFGHKEGWPMRFFGGPVGHTTKFVKVSSGMSSKKLKQEKTAGDFYCGGIQKIAAKRRNFADRKQTKHLKSQIVTMINM